MNLVVVLVDFFVGIFGWVVDEYLFEWVIFLVISNK